MPETRLTPVSRCLAHLPSRRTDTGVGLFLSAYRALCAPRHSIAHLLEGIAS